jgi:hypothetical protein
MKELKRTLLLDPSNATFNISDKVIFQFVREHLKPFNLLVVGLGKNGDLPNQYSKLLYSKLLDNKILHFVCDNLTLTQFRAMGFKNIINTSCSTMWEFTIEHCKDIPKTKAKDVIATLTDYDKTHFQKNKC